MADYVATLPVSGDDLSQVSRDFVLALRANQKSTKAALMATIKASFQACRTLGAAWEAGAANNKKGQALTPEQVATDTWNQFFRGMIAAGGVVYENTEDMRDTFVKGKQGLHQVRGITDYIKARNNATKKAKAFWDDQNEKSLAETGKAIKPFVQPHRIEPMIGKVRTLFGKVVVDLAAREPGKVREWARIETGAFNDFLDFFINRYGDRFVTVEGYFKVPAEVRDVVKSFKKTLDGIKSVEAVQDILKLVNDRMAELLKVKDDDEAATARMVEELPDDEDASAPIINLADRRAA